MTNYQAELPELFEIGVDLEAYGSMEELVDKCSYYLAHEEERKKIALNGYQKVKTSHSYQQRLSEMLHILSKPTFIPEATSKACAATDSQTNE